MTIGIFDLLLHKRDVSYSVKTLHEWIKKSGLHFVDFDEYEDRHDLNVKNLIEDFHLRKSLALNTKEILDLVSEILQGRVLKHSFYASKIDDSEANLLEPFNELYKYAIPRGLKKQLQEKRNLKKISNETMFNGFLSVGDFVPVNATLKDICSQGGKKYTFSFKLNRIVLFVIDTLIYSTKGISLDSLYAIYIKRWKGTVKKDEFINDVKEFYHSIRDTDLFLLKKRDVKQPPNLHVMDCYQIHSANV